MPAQSEMDVVAQASPPANSSGVLPTCRMGILPIILHGRDARATEEATEGQKVLKRR